MDRKHLERIRLTAPNATPGPWLHSYVKDGGCVYAVVEPTDWREKHGIATCGVYDGKKDGSVNLAKRNKNAAYISSIPPEIALEMANLLVKYEDAIIQKCNECPGAKANMCEGCALQKCSPFYAEIVEDTELEDVAIEDTQM